MREIEKIDYRNLFTVYREFFTHKECDLIIKEYELNKDKEQSGFNDGYSLEDAIDSPLLVRINNKKYIDNLYFKNIKKVVKDFNQNYQLEINYKDNSNSRILKYEKGKKCDWHIDIREYPLNRYKIDTVTMLSDTSDFEGGEFLFFIGFEQEIKLNKGDVIVFLPFVYHKVNEVKSGLRYTAVSFFNGKNPLK